MLPLPHTPNTSCFLWLSFLKFSIAYFGELFYNNITRLKKKYDLAIILVSHDLEYVLKHADNIVLLDKTVIKAGKTQEVCNSKEFKEFFGNIRFD